MRSADRAAFTPKLQFTLSPSLDLCRYLFKALIQPLCRALGIVAAAKTESSAGTSPYPPVPGHPREHISLSCVIH